MCTFDLLGYQKSGINMVVVLSVHKDAWEDVKQKIKDYIKSLTLSLFFQFITTNPFLQYICIIFYNFHLDKTA